MKKILVLLLFGLVFLQSGYSQKNVRNFPVKPAVEMDSIPIIYGGREWIIQPGTFPFVKGIIAGSNITVDNTTAAYPIISATASGTESKVANGLINLEDTIQLGGTIKKPIEIIITDSNSLWMGQEGSYGMGINTKMPAEFLPLEVANRILGFYAMDTSHMKYLSGILLDNPDSRAHSIGHAIVKDNPFPLEEQDSTGVVIANVLELDLDYLGHTGDTIMAQTTLGLHKDEANNIGDLFMKRSNPFQEQLMIGDMVNGVFLNRLSGNTYDRSGIVIQDIILKGENQIKSMFKQDTSGVFIRLLNDEQDRIAEFDFYKSQARLATYGTISLLSKTPNVTNPWEGQNYYFTNSGLKIFAGNKNESSLGFSIRENELSFTRDGIGVIHLSIPHSVSTGSHMLQLPDKSGTIATLDDMPAIVVPAPPSSGTYILKSIDGMLSWALE